MSRWPLNHLTAEDLDAFHSASLSTAAQQHLEECAECRTLVQQDRALLAALAGLPSFEPSAGFAERVMTRVQVSSAAPARRFAPQRVALAATLLLALGASIGWSLLNRALLLGWLNHSAAGIGRALWMGVRIVATNLSDQAWFSSLRALLSSSGKVALAGGVLLLAYGAALYALRRLLAAPGPAVPHAQG
jgi:hypothetical protein